MKPMVGNWHVADLEVQHGAAAAALWKSTIGLTCRS